MTFTPEILLSDQFAEFSGKVTALHEKKKELIAEFRKVYEAHKAEIKGIDDQSTELQGLFNEWASSTKTEKKVRLDLMGGGTVKSVDELKAKT